MPGGQPRDPAHRHRAANGNQQVGVACVPKDEIVDDDRDRDRDHMWPSPMRLLVGGLFVHTGAHSTEFQISTATTERISGARRSARGL